MSQKTNTPSIRNLYADTAKSLKNYPAVFLPFLIFTLIESLALILIFLAPRMPFIKVFGPPIRAFWGEGFLHYPINFLLLPKLAFLSRMVLSVFFASLLTAVAVAMIFNIYNKKLFKLNESFNLAIKKYISLFTVVLIITLLFYFLQKIIFIGLTKYFITGHSRLLFLNSRIWMGPILLFINFIIAVLIQSLFIYAIPTLIIDKERLLKSIIKSFVMFKKLFIPTLILVGLPMLIYIPVIILQYNSAFLINRLFPEFIPLVSFISIIISSLVIDPLVTVSTTFLYLENKEK